MMASSKVIFIIFSIICVSLLFPKIGADIITTHVSAEDLVFNIKLDSRIESNTPIQEKIREFETKDETIKWMDDNIRERIAIIASLQNDILGVHVKGLLEAKQHLDKAQARINELVARVVNLSKETEKLSQKQDAFESLAKIADKKISELNLKLASLTRINEEQKIRIYETERALQVAEEEIKKTKMQETAYFRELIEVQGSWFPYWLSVHLFHYQSFIYVQWKESGTLILDPMFQKALQKKAEFDKWVEPYIETINTKWIPVMKEQSLRLITQIELEVKLLTTKTSVVHHASKKFIQPFVGKLQEIVDPHFQEVKKFTKPYVDQVVVVAKPHVDNASSFLEPYTKKIRHLYTESFKPFTLYQLQLQTSIPDFLRNEELTEALKIILFLASAFMASQIIFRRKPNRPIERQNSHEKVAKGDKYLQRTRSGGYNGEITHKSYKKRRLN